MSEPAPQITVTPLKNRSFGAVVNMPSYTQDPSELNTADFNLLFNALHEHLVLVIPHQAGLSAKSQWLLTQRFDPTTSAGAYGHAKEFRHEKSVLKKDGCSVPSQPQVQVLGQGVHYDHVGLPEVQLTHPTHDKFHKDVLSDEEMAEGFTRFYRWHIDSAFYGLSPPVVTTLLGIEVPKGRDMKIRYEDTGEILPVTQAATAFLSGAEAFDLLSPEDQKFALSTTVVYAPHPYIYIAEAKATSDGLTMVNEGKELPLEELPEWEESKVKRLPMCWTNPVTKRQHLQVHGCCVWKLECADGRVIELEEAREIVHRMLRPAIAPERVYAHAWDEGDLVIFYNRGVLHSVTGQFAPGEKRLMHQCNIASGEDPVCEQ